MFNFSFDVLNSSIMGESAFEQVPFIELSQLEEMCEKYYGIKASSIQPMQGYFDRNYLIHNAADETKFVLKVSRLPGSVEEQMLNSQISLLKHLTRFGIPCPKIIPQTNGADWSRIKCEKMQCAVRMCTFLPGEQVAHLEFTPPLLTAFGDMIGRLHTATKSFNHPKKIYSHYWTLANALDSRKVIGVVKDDPQKFLLCTKVFDCFENAVIPLINRLPSGLIHSDLSEENLLATKSNDDQYAITCVLDFDEIHHSSLIFDVAIAIAHLTMRKAGDDFLERGKWILAGYSKHRALDKLELSALKYSVEARMLQAMINDLHYYSFNPTADDRQHVLDYQEAGWDQLNVLHELSNEDYLQIVLGQ